MPFKSQAQRRKFAQLLVEGKISPETYEEWNRETGGRRLPERAAKTTKRAPAKRARKSTTAKRNTARTAARTGARPRTRTPKRAAKKR